MLKILNAFIKEHRTELGLKGYSKMSYLDKLKYIEGKVKGTKYEREIGKLTKPRVDEGIKKVLEKSGRGQNVKVKTDKVKVRREKFEKAVKDLRKRVPPQEKQKSDPTPEMPKPCSLVNTLKPPKPESVKYLKDKKISTIQLNTLARPGAVKDIKPASMKKLSEIKEFFINNGLNSVEIIKKYTSREELPKYSEKLEKLILNMLAKRRYSVHEMGELLQRNEIELFKYLNILQKEGKVNVVVENDQVYIKSKKNN